MLSRFERRTDLALFLGLSLAATLLAAASVGGSLTHVGRTFPGFIVWDDLVVVALGRPSWTGMGADVPFRRRVASVDGQPLATRGELYALIREAPAGMVHHYVFAGQGEPETRDVPSMTLETADWALTMGVYLPNSIAFLVIGLAVFYLKPESRQSRALLAFATTWGVMLALCADLFTVGRLEQLYFLSEALVPAALLHLAVTFPEPRWPVKASGRPLRWLYAAALAVGLAQGWLFWRSVPGLLVLNTGVWLASAAAALASLGTIAWSAFRSASPLARRRARVVLAGAITAFAIPLCGLLALLLLGASVSTSLLVVTGFIFPLALGYAIARHDLFEADRFVKISLAYAILTVLVSLAYAGTVLAGDRMAAQLALSKSPYFPIAFVLLALATIVPLRERVQRGVDRLFYRERVDYKDTVARASERMTTLLDRDAIVAHVVTTLRDVLFIEGTTVWEREDGRLAGRGTAARGLLEGDHPGLLAFEALGRPLSADEIEESTTLRRQRETLRDLVTRLDATLLVPLARHDRTVGVLAVGRKASGGPLSADDVDVLRTLADQTAVALANATAVEQLEAARESLARAERLAAIGELSAAVAHGIRNPLAGIRLAAQLGLEHATPSDPVHENLADVLSEVDKLEAQVKGILDFARPFEPRLEATDVGGLVSGLLATVGPRLAASRIGVTLDVPRDLPAVRGDRAHLSQVLHELVANAIDAVAGGGTLSLSAAAVDGGRRRVRIAVADDGPGIPPELRERIFQLFVTTKRTGTGVGLAVAKKIVERHGGTIAVQAVEPHGTRFVIELPAA